MIVPDFQDHPDAIPQAILSGDGRYRYLLTRKVSTPPGNSRGEKTVLFLVLNPSTAVANDPTIRKCIGYASRWGCSRLWVCNLSPLRTPKPQGLRMHGPDHDDVRAASFRMTRAAADLVVAAWGRDGHWVWRDTAILGLLSGIPLQCLGRTADGQPKHPLYLKNDAALASFP